MSDRDPDSTGSNGGNDDPPGRPRMLVDTLLDSARFPSREEIERDLREAAKESAGPLSCPCGWSGGSGESVETISGTSLTHGCPDCGRGLMIIEINY
jgi:hypothetical protein